MRDFPVFTTENGAASLVLREIPYRGVAYITLQDTQNPKELLAECVDFCKIAGAEKIYATGHSWLERYPVYTSVVKMQRLREGLTESGAALFPVTEKTVEQWRSLYNAKMQNVPNASTMTRMEVSEFLKKGGGYFVHKDGELLGIGIAREDKIEAIASTKPGAGETVLLALCSALFSENVVLEVAFNNERAIRLYERLGFLKTELLRTWYDVSK
ncbi:MAG: GNAT family N-acetyltransferase [Oscillospiraceae bacterium]|nr:GNAT family N-acetyltransferase [Oscillospiraceae bacterium]